MSECISKQWPASGARLRLHTRDVIYYTRKHKSTRHNTTGQDTSTETCQQLVLFSHTACIDNKQQHRTSPFYILIIPMTQRHRPQLLSGKKRKPARRVKPLTDTSNNTWLHRAADTLSTSQQNMVLISIAELRMIPTPPSNLFSYAEHPYGRHFTYPEELSKQSQEHPRHQRRQDFLPRPAVVAVESTDKKHLHIHHSLCQGQVLDRGEHRTHGSHCASVDMPPRTTLATTSTTQKADRFSAREAEGNQRRNTNTKVPTSFILRCQNHRLR